jgi:hypothetical protein
MDTFFGCDSSDEVVAHYGYLTLREGSDEVLAPYGITAR